MNTKKYSEDIANAIKDFLEKEGLSFSFDDQNGVFEFGMKLKEGLKRICYIIEVLEDEYTVLAIAPLGPDSEDKELTATLSKFICQANYGLINGSFDFDPSDGEIRFKSFVDCSDIVPTTEMIEHSIFTAAVMFSLYGNGMIDIIFGNATADEAIRRCEPRH